MKGAFLIPAALLLAAVGCGNGGAEASLPKTPDPVPTSEQQAANARASEIARGQAESNRGKPPL